MSWFFLVSVALAMPLDEAVDAALTRSPTADLARARVDAAEAQLSEVRARWMPTASANAGIVGQNRVTFSVANMLPDIPLIDPTTIEPVVVQPGFLVQVGAEATQPLFVPSLSAAKASAELGQDLARASGEVDRRRVEDATVRVWHASAQAHAMRAQAERGVQLAEALLAKGQAIVELGAAAEDQLLPFQVGVARARANLVQAEAGVITADGLLEQLSGLSGGASPAEPPTSAPELSVALAGVQRADLREAGARVSAAQSVADLQRASRLPTVAATASLNVMDPAPGFGDTVNWRVGLGARVPLTQGGVVRAKLDQANAQAAQARAGLALQEERAAIEVRQAHGELVRALAGVTAREDVVRIAQASTAAAERRMNGGEASMLAVQRAQAEQLAAEAQLTQARSEAALAADLLRLAGR